MQPVTFWWLRLTAEQMASVKVHSPVGVCPGNAHGAQIRTTLLPYSGTYLGGCFPFSFLFMQAGNGYSWNKSLWTWHWLHHFTLSRSCCIYLLLPWGPAQASRDLVASLRLGRPAAESQLCYCNLGKVTPPATCLRFPICSKRKIRLTSCANCFVIHVWKAPHES